MNKRIVKLDTDSHKAVEALLPWYLTGKLDPAERGQVDCHLAQCAHCRGALAWEQSLRAQHLAAQTSPPDVEAALGRMHAKIAADTCKRVELPSLAAIWYRWLAVTAWARWTMAAQFAAVAVLMVIVIAGPPRLPGVYHALNAAPATGAVQVAVTFDPNAREADIRQLLLSIDAHVVYGPTATNAYQLQLSGNRATAMTTLHASKVVTLAVAMDKGQVK